MKIQFLGTAAAEGIPALYCQCDVCKEANEKRGRFIRSRCQTLINDDLLLDFGPDTYYHMLTYQVPLDRIHHVLITHNHSDHFYSNELCFRRKGYASKVEEEPLFVYGADSVYQEALRVIKSENMEQYVQARFVQPFESFQIKDYTIIPLKANHDKNAGPLNYIIRQNDKTILYAHDTGYYSEEVWKFLEKLYIHFDLISLDCTAGLLTNWKDHHLSFDCFLEVIERLKEMKLIDQHTKIMANHFSHNGQAGYEKMRENALKHHVEVTYDGMIIEI